MLLEEITRLALELDLLDTTFTLDTAFKEDDAVTTGLAGTEDAAGVELTLLELELTFELELNWLLLDAVKLLTEDTSPEAWLGTELLNNVLGPALLKFDISASSALLNVLDLLDTSPSIPAAPPHAVNIIERIMPQKGSLALFSAEENIFLYH